MVSDPLERLLRGRDGREFHRGLLFGDAQPDTALAAGEQSLQESLWQRNCNVPHQRRRNVADGSKLGFSRFRRGDGPCPRAERFLLRQIGWVGKGTAWHQTSAAAARSSRRQPWRITWSSYE